jgi:cytochrome P450
MALDRGVSGVARPVTVPAPPAPLGLWATWRTARRNVLELIPEPAFREPALAGGSRRGWLMLMDPAGLEHVLKTAEANYPKSRVTLRMLQPRDGRSLFTSDGPSWRMQRRAMAPAFQHRALVGLAPIMTVAAEACAGRVAERIGRDRGTIDLYPEMVAATCDVICDAALSGRAALDRSALTEGVTRFIATAARLSLLDLLDAPDWVPRPGRLLDRDGPRMDRMIDAIVKARMATGPSEPPDLLDLLIAARDPETGEGLSPADIRNNLTAFLMAGHETTALALTWALYLLALDPAVQARARDAAQAALGDGPADAAALERLGYVRQVIEEAVRLYPPAALLTRNAREADEVAGRPVGQGATVILPIYALHRHRLLWDDPDAFDPDRFAPEAVRARHRFAYLPFAAGPKVCIGLGFAMMEAQIILATLVARFRFALPQGFAPDPRMRFTLRPGTGMPLVVSRL